MIRNVDKTITGSTAPIPSPLAEKNKSIPSFDLIEPRYAYGKDLYVSGWLTNG